jgi:hypothetical protein
MTELFCSAFYSSLSPSMVTDMQVTLKHIFISSGHNYKGRHGKGAMDYAIDEVERIDCVAGRGIKDDRFFDYEPDFKGQITLFDWAVFERVRDEIVKGALHPMAFRRNVVVQGIDLNTLINQRFTLGDLELTGSCECTPCYWMDQACAPGTYEFLKGQGGLRARITKGGSLTLGECDLEVIESVEPREEDVSKKD